MTCKPGKLNKVVSAFHGRLGMLIILLLGALLIATGFVWSQKKVSIMVDGKAIEVHTTSTNPQDVLQAAGINLNPLDEYRLSTEKLSNGTTIDVYRAVQVNLIHNGMTKKVVTAKPTVGEAAAAMGFDGSAIRLLPEANTQVSEGMTIKIMTVRDDFVEEVQPIAYQTVRQSDSGVEKGVEHQVQQGENGLKKVAMKRSFADDELTATQIIGETVIKEATPEIIAVGARDTVETSRGMMRFRAIKWMEATAYNPTDGSGEGITATGIAARHGIVAVDPDVIPLGSRVYIPGYGLALAADTGGDIVGDRIDLCMEGYNEAWHFGRRNVKVYVLD